MKVKITVVKEGEKTYTAYIEELNVCSCGKTKSEAIESVKESLKAKIVHNKAEFKKYMQENKDLFPNRDQVTVEL